MDNPSLIHINSLKKKEKKMYCLKKWECLKKFSIPYQKDRLEYKDVKMLLPTTNQYLSGILMIEATYRKQTNETKCWVLTEVKPMEPRKSCSHIRSHGGLSTSSLKWLYSPVLGTRIKFLIISYNLIALYTYFANLFFSFFLLLLSIVAL